MIKTTGFRTIPVRYNRFNSRELLCNIHQFGWMGGVHYRSGWPGMPAQWMSVSYDVQDRRRRNRLFRESQLGWRSWQGKAPVRRS